MHLHGAWALTSASRAIGWALTSVRSAEQSVQREQLKRSASESKTHVLNALSTPVNEPEICSVSRGNSLSPEFLNMLAHS
jgi:hypothetical protein